MTGHLAPYVMSTSFPKFSVPEKGEGFDEIRHMWAKDGKAVEYMKQRPQPGATEDQKSQNYKKYKKYKIWMMGLIQLIK